MRELFNHWDKARRVLAPPNRVLWLFDFDGTLAPIVKHPDGAIMRPAIRSLLQKLERRFPGRVGMLSGRPLKHLRQKTGIKNLIYGGAQGFEIKGPRFTRDHPLPPRRRQRFRAWIRAQRRAIVNFPGVWIEDKKWTSCIHFRQASLHDRRGLRAFLRKSCNQARQLGFKSQKGLESLEFYSDARWNKGKAARWLKTKCRATIVFYVGDDATDETVFRALEKSGVTVRIGPSRISKAKYYLRRQSESEALLKRILTL